MLTLQTPEGKVRVKFSQGSEFGFEMPSSLDACVPSLALLSLASSEMAQ